mmetsp:Transcript_14109/g.40092  ORF Transcript_14109/g.40092 Transcript_14109/m.40092 type:complete len:106 (-) Transcript_14109:3-320(-)
MLLSGVCGMRVLTVLQATTVPAIAFGRIPQIVMNWKNGDTGELSLTTCVLNFAGNLVRIFTTLVMTQDLIILVGFGLNLIVNTTLMLQCLDTELAARRKAKFALE